MFRQFVEFAQKPSKVNAQFQKFAAGIDASWMHHLESNGHLFKKAQEMFAAMRERAEREEQLMPKMPFPCLKVPLAAVKAVVVAPAPLKHER